MAGWHQDHPARLQAFEWLEEQVDIHGDILSRSLLEQGFVYQDSYRKTSRLINRMRHQTEEEGTPFRTLCDGSESEGTHILAHIEARTEQILEHHAVPSEGLAAEEMETASASTTLSSEAIQTAVEACELSKEGKEEMADNPVPYEDPSTQTYVAIDGVGAKRQEAHRHPNPAPDPAPEAKKEKKKKKYVCAVSALSRSVIIDQEYRDFLYAPHLSIPDGSKTSKEGGECSMCGKGNRTRAIRRKPIVSISHIGLG